MSGSGDDQLELILRTINRNRISLPECEAKRNRQILEEVVRLFIAEMKRLDPLFATLYRRVFCGGSFYEGLRVGKPQEFDLDLLLSIPKRAGARVSISNISGFVTCRVDEPAKVTGLNKFVDRHGNLRNPEVRQWMEGLTIKAMNALCSSVYLTVHSYRFEAFFVKSGPVMTLHLSCDNIVIDVDFVPCFVFAQDQWPAGGYRPNPAPSETEFFLVPKMHTNEKVPADTGLLWLLSFQEQERALLNGKKTLKPALRLLKKLRDHQENATIASYYLKTIFLWEVQQNGGTPFLRSSLSEVFLKMFEKYIEWLGKGEIPYFWNKKNNLLGSCNPVTVKNIWSRMLHIRSRITCQDPLLVCHYLGTPVTEAEMEEVRSDTENSWCSVV